MKIDVEILLPSAYGLFASIIIINMLSSDVGFNTLTMCVYFANILVVYILYKVGRRIDKWLK